MTKSNKIDIDFQTEMCYNIYNWKKSAHAHIKDKDYEQFYQNNSGKKFYAD